MKIIMFICSMAVLFFALITLSLWFVYIDSGRIALWIIELIVWFIGVFIFVGIE